MTWLKKSYLFLKYILFYISILLTMRIMSSLVSIPPPWKIILFIPRSSAPFYKNDQVANVWLHGSVEHRTVSRRSRVQCKRRSLFQSSLLQFLKDITSFCHIFNQSGWHINNSKWRQRCLYHIRSPYLAGVKYSPVLVASRDVFRPIARARNIWWIIQNNIWHFALNVTEWF